MNATRLSAALLCTAVLLGIGCDVDTDSEDADFRNGSPFWNWKLGADANGDVEVYAGEGANPFDLIWDIDDGTTSSASGDAVPGDEGTFVHHVDGNAILAADGEVLCTVEQSQLGNKKAYQLLDADGEVLLTSWHRFVFAGDVTVPGSGSGLGELIANDTLLSFHGDQVFFDRWWTGEVAVTVSADLNQANPMRKLVLAALVAGECGSDGLP